jgi:hypothetical protein
MGAEKVVRTGRPLLSDLAGRWASLNGCSADGYEIRYGAMSLDGDERTAWADENVLATTWHGLLEDPTLTQAVLGVDVVDPLDATFELLADAVEEQFDASWLRTFLG